MAARCIPKVAGKCRGRRELPKPTPVLGRYPPSLARHGTRLVAERLHWRRAVSKQVPQRATVLTSSRAVPILSCSDARSGQSFSKPSERTSLTTLDWPPAKDLPD